MKLTEDASVSVKQLAPGKAKRILSEGNTVSYTAPVPEEEITDESTEETPEETTEGTENTP